MELMNFPKPFVGWVYECISAASFSIIINGRPVGYIKSYQGICQLPLLFSRLTISDCLALFDRITSMLDKWSNRYLTQDGRPTLIKYISFSMVVYWAKGFFLPSKLLKMIRSAMMRFFWCGSIHKKKPMPCSFSLFEKPR